MVKNRYVFILSQNVRQYLPVDVVSRNVTSSSSATFPRLSINRCFGTMHRVPPAVRVAPQSYKEVSDYRHHKKLSNIYPNTDVERIVGELEDTTIQNTEQFTRTNQTLDNRPMTEDDA